MDKTDLGEEKRKKKRGFLDGTKKSLKEAWEKRKQSRDTALMDVITFALGFIFARCHVIFGAHPIALAFISILPSRVWLATFAAVLGSLTMGKSGFIYAMISIIVVFLRIIVSGSGGKEEQEKDTLFGEALLLKMSGSLIGGFIAAIYELLLRGFTAASVAFGLSMVLLPPLIVFALSGLFDTGVTFSSVFRGSEAILSFSNIEADKERFNRIFFCCSALFLLFITAISLKDYRFVGIDVAYIFAGVATFFVAKRFGALRACAAGFAAALGLGSTTAVAFALVGLTFGVLINVGAVYAIIGGGLILGGWCAYCSGVSGLLSALPEYAIAATLATPLLKGVKAPPQEKKKAKDGISPEEMVGTMALSYKNRYSGALDLLEVSLSRVSSVTGRYYETLARPTKEEIADLIIQTKERYCRTCRGYDGCLRAGGQDLPDADTLASMILEKGRLDLTDLRDLPDHCGMNEGICESINRAIAILSKEKYMTEGKRDNGGIFRLLSELISDARLRDAREISANEELCARLGEAFDEADLDRGVARVFGERKKHFIIAAEDEKGDKISSPEFKRAIERIAGVKLGRPEFYRRDKMALMEVSSIPEYTLECASASVAGGRDEICGDCTKAFETEDAHFFALISDGMGSGGVARSTASFVTSFLEQALSSGGGCEEAMRLLNNELMCRHTECSATADVFCFDRMTGEAVFYKSGSAPSFVKREGSVFRIRSRTTPLGLMKDTDIERIRADVRPEDYVIMLSDGVLTDKDESATLAQILSKPPKRNLTEYARSILSDLPQAAKVGDDMTVTVVKITRTLQ